MTLHKKIILILGTVIALGVFLASFAIYQVAEKHLMDKASFELTHGSLLFNSQIAERFHRLLSLVEAWSRSPYVHDVVDEPGNTRNIKRLNEAFLNVVKSDPVLQSFNLVDNKAACIASSIPSRIGLKEMQEVVSQKDDFLTALTGKSIINGAYMAVSSGRPIVSIAVPVWRHGEVKAVLRPIVDMEWFGRYCMNNLWAGNPDDLFIFSPELDLNKYAGHDFTLLIETPYEAPGIPPVIPGFEAKSGIVSYGRKGIDRMAAFYWMETPRWLIVVERQLDLILEPIKDIKTAAWIIALGLFVLVWLLSGMAMKSILTGLNSCMEMVRQVGDGDLGARVKSVVGGDIGRLARGLNDMASHLEQQRDILKANELKYRSIFENSAEGIFQTREDGSFIAVNPAMLNITGAGDVETLMEINAKDLYFDSKTREDALEILRSTGKLHQFTFLLKRLDGETRHCQIHARAEKEDSGRIILIQGVLNDITAEYQARESRKKARKAEKLFQDARQKTLRYQLNPHFMFNVLNTLGAMAHHSTEQMSDLLQKLSFYLRSILTPKEDLFLHLELELEAVKAYLDIEAVRFNEDLQVQFIIDSLTHKVTVPDMILQPLVENAVKYGMRTSSMPLKIEIETRLINDITSLMVKNSGKWIAPENSSSPTQLGLTNLKERLGLVYGKDALFSCHEDQEWVTVELQLPARFKK